MPHGLAGAIERTCRRATIALLVVAVALLLPREASASCGGHVHYAGDTNGCAPGVECPVAPPPCTGPGCSQAPDAPPLVPSTAPQRAGDSALAELFHFAPAVGNGWGAPPPEPHVMRPSSPPDPPPRARP